MISALWQGPALALALALCLRLTPRIAAADRFRAWAAGFATLVTLPFLPQIFVIVRSLFTNYMASPAASLPVSTAAAPRAWLNLDPRWSLAIAGVWIAASLARAIDLGVHTLRLRWLWKRAVPVPSEIQLETKVEICATQDLDRPSVIGFFSPRILIPAWLLERLTPAEVEQVVLHEAEHLRRCDDWINLLQKLSLVLFPLNPALAWMERRLCREREIACDEGVVRQTQAPRAYAACLASLAERRLERQRGLARRAEGLSLGAWQRRPELVDRVHRILRRGPNLHPAAARLLLALMGCGLVSGAVELARCPQVVEFMAQPAAAPASPNLDATFDRPPMRGFHAINAMVRVPSRAGLGQARLAQRIAAGKNHILAKRSQQEDPSAPRRFADDRSENRASRTLAQADGSRADASALHQTGAISESVAAQPEQWIVYTEWEQVESTSTATDENATRTAGTPPVARQYRVTQLILRVVPAVAAESRAAKAGAIKPGDARRADTSSKVFPITPLPAAIPIRDGWLVIEL